MNLSISATTVLVQANVMAGLWRKNIDMSGSHWVLIPVMFDIGYILRWFDKR